MNVNEPDSTGWHKSSFSGGNGACIEVAWRKSTFSGGNGGCVEVAWRKSSYSGGQGNCVEVAAMEARVLLRDSKNPGGPTLAVSTGHWRELLQRVG